MKKKVDGALPQAIEYQTLIRRATCHSLCSKPYNLSGKLGEAVSTCIATCSLHTTRASTMTNVGSTFSIQLPHVIAGRRGTSATAAGLATIRAPIPFSCMTPAYSTRDEITPHRCQSPSILYLTNEKPGLDQSNSFSLGGCPSHLQYILMINTQSPKDPYFHYVPFRAPDGGSLNETRGMQGAERLSLNSLSIL